MAFWICLGWLASKRALATGSSITSLTELTDTYTEKNPAADRKRASRVLEKLRKIINNPVGVIELADDLDIETKTYAPWNVVTEVGKNPGLLTRELFVCYNGLPYNYQAVHPD